MSRTVDEQLKRRPIDEARVSAIESNLRQEIRSARLKEIRCAYVITQTTLAQQLHVSQNRVSRIERGDIDKTQVETLRRYSEALGGELTVEATFGRNDTFSLANNGCFHAAPGVSRKPQVHQAVQADLLLCSLDHDGTVQLRQDA